MTARKVVGTVDTSEFAIAISATLGFILSLGWESVNWLWVGALMIGGVIAAPIAAWLVRMIPAQLMGVLVGGFIILVNSRTILNTWVTHEAYYPVVYGLICIVWGLAIVVGIRKTRKKTQITDKEMGRLIS